MRPRVTILSLLVLFGVAACHETVPFASPDALDGADDAGVQETVGDGGDGDARPRDDASISPLTFTPPEVSVEQITGHLEGAPVLVRNTTAQVVRLEDIYVLTADGAIRRADPETVSPWDGFSLDVAFVPELPFDLAPGQALEIRVQFGELQIGPVDSTLVVEADGEELTVPLHGEATRCTPWPIDVTCTWTQQQGGGWRCELDDGAFCRFLCTIDGAEPEERCVAFLGSSSALTFQPEGGCAEPGAGDLAQLVCSPGKAPDCPPEEDVCELP